MWTDKESQKLPPLVERAIADYVTAYQQVELSLKRQDKENFDKERHHRRLDEFGVIEEKLHQACKDARFNYHDALDIAEERAGQQQASR